MRPVAQVLLVAALAAGGCRGRAPAAEPASTTRAANGRPEPQAAAAAAAGRAPGLDPLARAHAAAPPARPGLECSRLLSSAEASQALGRPVALVAEPAGSGHCVYRAAAGGSGPEALIDVVIGCGEAAAPIARSVLTRAAAGYREVQVGQRAVVVDDKGQGVVQFLLREAPCAVEVTAVPAGRAVEVARAVERGVAAGARP